MKSKNIQLEETKKVILVVDDLELNREILKISFESECRILEAQSGLEALEILKKEKVDLVITDIVMADMDGHKLIREIRNDKRWRDMPIIAVTEHNEVEQQKVLESGANAFVCKPFVTSALHSSVESILFNDEIKNKINQFHLVFDQNPIAFILYHLLADSSGEYTDYEIAYANEASAKMLEIDEMGLTGMAESSFPMIHLDFLQKANKSEGKEHETVHDEKTGKYLNITAYQESEGYIGLVMNDITRQVRQEKQLRAERDKFSHLLDAVPNGIAVYDVTPGGLSTINYFNDEICLMSGYSREEIEAGGAQAVLRTIPEDEEKVKSNSLKVLRADRTVDMEYRTRRKNGEIRYLRVKMAIERINNKKLNVYAAYTDVTMHKKAEQAIAAEMKNLEAAQDKNLLAKCRVNVTKDLLDNYIGDERLYLPKEDSKYSVTVSSVANLCATQDMTEEFTRRMMPDNLLEAFAEGKREVKLDYLRRMKDLTVIWVRTAVRLYSEPETQELMGFMYTYDINEEKTLQMILDHVSETEFDMMGLLYLQKNNLHCVRASEMELQLGHRTDIPYKIGISEFVKCFIAPDVAEEVMYKMDPETIRRELETKKSYVFTYPVHFHEKTLQKKWEFSYLNNEQKIVIFTRSDITELFEEQAMQRENLRNALLQAERASHAKTDFLSHMSHEIRTPMNAIIGMSTLAAQCVNDPQQVAECISKVGISARFLLSLINDILDMSRIESGKVTLKKEEFQFEDFINNINTIIYNQARNKGLDYDCVITSFLNSRYIGDPTKLQQILINLLGNAVKFTPPGGKTQFIIHQSKVENAIAYMSFTINDTGVGMSDEFQESMFEPFEQQENGTTTHYQGTGLGLAICKNLVEMMQGTITVNSIEGVGSEFTVNIPLEICAEEPYYNVNAEISFEKLKALIVDDDVLICENTQNILSEMGIRAEWVSSGEQAVTLITEKKNQKKFFDIVLLDWKMPDMDGIETARQIRRVVGSDVTIIVITAYDWSAIEVEAKAAGVNMLITKPLFKSTLMSAFQRVFTEKVQKEETYQPVEYDFSGKHIMLVEDHILNVEVARRLIESKHGIVEVAENGLKSIELFAKASDYYYDVILMDIRMPVMDGLTAARSIRQLSNPSAETIPIIAMSANAFDEDIEKSKAAGMNAHLAKPIEPELLYATLDKYLKA